MILPKSLINHEFRSYHGAFIAGDSKYASISVIDSYQYTRSASAKQVVDNIYSYYHYRTYTKQAQDFDIILTNLYVSTEEEDTMLEIGLVDNIHVVDILESRLS